MTVAYTNILCEVSDGVARVTVNRPDKMNALNAATIGELDACFAELGRNEAARVVVLTGAGPKAFVAGADIGELAALNAGDAERLAARGQALMNRIENLGKPVVAAVNGFALGGGCELAMACTFRYASDNAKLGLPETGLGLIPGFGGRSFRMRFHRDAGGANGSGQLLVAGEPTLYQFAWPGPGTAIEDPEDTLTFVDQWTPGDYAGELQDCRIFDMSDVYPGEGLKVLAVKNSEAFSVVDF